MLETPNPNETGPAKLKLDNPLMLLAKEVLPLSERDKLAEPPTVPPKLIRLLLAFRVVFLKTVMAPEYVCVPVVMILMGEVAPKVTEPFTFKLATFMLPLNFRSPVPVTVRPNGPDRLLSNVRAVFPAVKLVAIVLLPVVKSASKFV